MPDELIELLDAAIYREIASEAFYLAGQKNTHDAGAIALMRELAEEESKHLEWLKKQKEKGVTAASYRYLKVPDLRISEYLTGGDTLEATGLQDTLIIAIKREQQAIEFYAKMMGALRESSAKRLCQRLARAELEHKYKLETLYDDLFYLEN